MEYATTFVQALSEACSAYKGEKCYIDEIPQKIESRLRQKFEVPEEARLIAFFDGTVFGYGKDGIVVTTRGIYWKALWSKMFLPWSKLAKITAIQIQKGDLKLDSVFEFSLASCPLSGDQLAALVTELRDVAQKFALLEDQGNQGSAGRNEETLGQALLRVCSTYLRNKVYAHPIPEEMLEKVRSHCNIPQDDPVLVYFDFTMIGKGRGGIAFTEEGLYWKAFSGSFVSWTNLEPPNKWSSDAGTLRFSNNEIPLLGSPLKVFEWIDLLQEISELPQVVLLREEIGSTDDGPGLKADTTVESTLDQALLRILQPYGGAGIYKKTLPGPIHERIREHFDMAAECSVWAYFDFTNFGKGKEGIVFTDQGLYWRVYGSGKAFIPWYRIRQAEVAFVPDQSAVFLDSVEKYSILGSPISGEEWIDLLEKVKALPHLAEFDTPILASYPDESYPLLDEEFIEAVCRAHAFFDKLSDYERPPEQIALIRQACQIPDPEQLVAFHETAQGSQGPFGVAITGRAVCIHNASHSCKRARVILPLAGLAELNLILRDKSLYLGGEEIFHRGDAASLHALLADLQVYAESIHAAENPVEYPYDPSYAASWHAPVQIVDEERWIVAVGGMLQGVYSTSELKWVAETAQLDPWQTRLWKKGLPAWVSAKTAGLVE
ncbi:hypothetical protein ACI7RC_23680 [Brevibacillus sp. B_LB10_24]|uniref:hypothetical protein n=1 Tax=Brevibacillus sp. B_LB10_24 TaxID=3380645 RepID=UPI0038B8F343